MNTHPQTQNTAQEEQTALSEPHRLHPSTLILRLLLSLPALVYLLLPIFRSGDTSSWFSLGAAVFYGIITIPLLLLQYNVFRYWITSDEMVIVSGIFSRKKRSIPLEHIQNISIEQRLLARMLGTAKVKIESGGSSDTEGKLEYVSLGQARRIQHTVKRYRGRGATAAERRHSAGIESHGQAASESPRHGAAESPRRVAEERGDGEAAPGDFGPYHEDEEDPDVEHLHDMAPGRVLLAGTFQFSLVFIAVAFTLLEYSGLQVDDVIDWVANERIAAIAGDSPFLTIAGTMIMAVLAAWISGILLTFNQYYRFDLSLSEEKMHRHMGLLTLSDRTIPLNKIQILIERTNPLMRRFGWYRLEAQTLGVGGDQEGSQVVLPFARRGDIDRVVERLHPREKPQTWHRVSPLTIRRRFLRYSIGVGLLAAVEYFIWSQTLWALLLLPLLLALAYAQYRMHQYAFVDGTVYVRQGVFSQRCWIVPLKRFQALESLASIFQRRLKLKSLAIDTAGAQSYPYPSITDLPQDDADDLVSVLKSRPAALTAPL